MGRAFFGVDFEWELAKEKTNRIKHGVDFSSVPIAFEDPQNLILPDAMHSGQEERYYCIGYDGAGILTVRFTIRNQIIRVIGAGYWRKQRQLYEKTNHQV